MVDAKTEAEVTKLVKTLCAKFPAPYNTLCDTLVEQYVPQIMTWLSEGLEKVQVCKKLGFCPKTRQANGFKANAFTCTLCQTVVQMVEKVMVDTKVEADVQALVGKVCLKFPAPYDTLCQSLVGQFIPTIMEYLEQGLEKLDVCRKIKMCPKADAVSANKFDVAGPLTCTICTTIVSSVEQYIIDQKTEAEAIALLKKLCVKFPAPYNTLCDTLVEQYVPQIMQWAEQGIEKVEICKKLKFCTDGKMLRTANGWKPSALSCSVCQTIVKYVEETITSSSFTEQVEFLINKLCAKLPDQYVDLCTTTVNEYIPYMLQLLEQGVEKIDICTRIKMCEKKVHRQHRHARRSNGFNVNGFACNICKTIVDKVIEVIKSTTVESEVIAKVEVLCAKFPAPYNTLCNTLVEQYVPQMIEWAAQGLESIEICKKIKMCKNGNQKAVIYSANGFKANPIVCTVCQTIVTYVEQIMVDTKVESAIQEQISKLCTKFPAPYSTLCDTLVGQYIPMIMQWAEQGLEKAEICKKIKLCA
jgi:saposin